MALTPKAFDVLLFLVQNPNRLVTKEELLKAVWGDTFVEEGNLTQHVSHLRKALGDSKVDDGRLIVTLARKGYQFTATVTAAEMAGTLRQAPAIAPPMEQGPSRGASNWRKAPLALVFALILVTAGYVFWERIRAPGPARSQKVRLAVLPFRNLTGDPDKEYLADGLTEEVISQLSRVASGRLGVIARTSVMGYKNKDERLDQIGRDLSVEYVLESSVRESGNKLRLTAQLIQVSDQTHIWSKDYDYQAKDVLALEEDVARALTQEIQIRLGSPHHAELARPYPVNTEAFDAYLKGFYFFQRNTDSDSEMAAKYYERATQLEPSYALAWVGLSRVRNWQVNIGRLPAQEGHLLARQAIDRALALNPSLAAAHTQMGRLQEQVDFDWVAAAASKQRAVDLEPGNPDAVRSLAGSHLVFGRFDEALKLNRRATDLDPLNPDNWEFAAETEYEMGQLEQAARDGRKALEVSPDVWPGHILLAKILVMQGRPQEALREVEQVRHAPIRASLLPIVYHALGRRSEADAALTELIAKYEAESYAIAKVYAFRNEPDKAFRWLDRAYAQRDSGLIETKVDPFLKSLHHDPRYTALLKKLNFPI